MLPYHLPPKIQKLPYPPLSKPPLSSPKPWNSWTPSQCLPLISSQPTPLSSPNPLPSFPLSFQSLSSSFAPPQFPLRRNGKKPEGESRSISSRGATIRRRRRRHLLWRRLRRRRRAFASSSWKSSWRERETATLSPSPKWFTTWLPPASPPAPAPSTPWSCPTLSMPITKPLYALPPFLFLVDNTCLWNSHYSIVNDDILWLQFGSHIIVTNFVVLVTTIVLIIIVIRLKFDLVSWLLLRFFSICQISY